MELPQKIFKFMSKLNPTEITKIAKLAKLKFNADELNALQKDLENVLSMIEEIEDVDVANIEPMAHPLNLNQRLREDNLDTELMSRDAIYRVCGLSRLQFITFKNAPKIEKNLFLVPNVIPNL